MSERDFLHTFAVPVMFRAILTRPGAHSIGRGKASFKDLHSRCSPPRSCRQKFLPSPTLVHAAVHLHGQSARCSLLLTLQHQTPVATAAQQKEAKRESYHHDPCLYIFPSIPLRRLFLLCLPAPLEFILPLLLILLPQGTRDSLNDMKLLRSILLLSIHSIY